MKAIFATFAGLLLFFLPSLALAQNFRTSQQFFALVHLTDPQWTFARRGIGFGDQIQDGTLAVAGTERSVENIVKVVTAALGNGRMKFSVSGDAHFEAEIKDASQNGEFHDPYRFPRHGMRGEAGPGGDRFIFEIEKILSSLKVTVFPAHFVNAMGKLEITPVNVLDVQKAIAEVNTVLRFEKNGVGSYSVFVNPAYRAYLNEIDPQRNLAHFHFGWCTDFCDYWVMKEELQMGYRVIFIADAAAGVGAKTTGNKMRELLNLGLEVITTNEFLELNTKWAKSHGDRSSVNEDLNRQFRISPTKARLQNELRDPRFADPAHPGDLGEPCAVLLQAKP